MNKKEAAFLNRSSLFYFLCFSLYSMLMNNHILPHIFLRLVIFITLLAHSIPSMISGDVNNFGEFYLNKAGFAPIGIQLAWAIKLSHVVCAICILLNRFLKPASWVTILILLGGIIMIHYKEGWYVVGFGRNGMEFNVVLIGILFSFLFPDFSFRKKYRP